MTRGTSIYRLAPSLLIATVDKFAQLPWNGYAGLLFGRVTELEWRRKRDENSSALGYRKEKHKTTVVNGLLRRADGSRWTELTVGMSMRETENEINLLLPGGGAFLEDPSGGGPDWNFGAADTETDRDLAATVDSDEYGPTTADTPRKAQR